MLANHKDNKTLIDGELVTVKKGSFITSKRKLGIRWKWSNTKVDNFLKLLEQDEMIKKKSDTKKTVITIVKYEVYHELEKEKRHENETETKQKRNRNETETNKQELKNLRTKELNNNNNNKNSASRFFEENGFGYLGGHSADQLIDWMNKLPEDVIILAMQESVERGARNWKYLNKVLEDWLSRGLKTTDAVMAEKKRFSEQSNPNNIINLKGGASTSDPRNYDDHVGHHGVQLYK